jgi:hypothetical protein
MKLDKALAWTGLRKRETPTPWWKRPLRWLEDLVSRVKASNPPEPQAVASNWWARGAAVAGAATAGIVVLARRRRQTSDEATDASEPSESAGAAEEGTGATTARDA